MQQYFSFVNLNERSYERRSYVCPKPRDSSRRHTITQKASLSAAELLQLVRKGPPLCAGCGERIYSDFPTREWCTRQHVIRELAW